MQSAKAIVDQHFDAMQLLGIMFNEDADMWSDPTEIDGITTAVLPRFNRDHLTGVVAQLDSLLSGRFTEEELMASYRYAGASLDFGCSTGELLATVRDHIRTYLAR